jgi:molybdate transport system substrate-binding protein
MSVFRGRSGRATFAVFLWFAFAATAAPAELKVMISSGYLAAYRALLPGFEAATGDKIQTVIGPSMGETANAIPNRLARGERADVLIMVDDALKSLVEKGVVRPESRVDLARSLIGVVVRAGAPKPDVSTVAALKQTLIAAKSVAYSDSASGVYVSTTLFKRLGVEEAMKDKARMIPAEPVAAVVARGDAEIGFQQISELLPIPGADFVGALPNEVQKVTVYSAGAPVRALEPDAAKALIDYLSSPVAYAAVRSSGLEPIAIPETSPAKQ